MRPLFSSKHDTHPEQPAERALSPITGENIRIFYVVKVADAIRQAIDGEKQRCILDARDLIRWELEQTIGPDKVNEVGGKIQRAIHSRK
jgi:hypothetical protein